MELASGFFSEAVYAEWPRTRGGDVQEHETKQNCRVAAIVYRSKYMAFGGHMAHEVGECHFAGANERGDPSEQAQNNKDAPDDFDKAGNAEKGKKRHLAYEKLGHAMQKEIGRAPCRERVCQNV